MTNVLSTCWENLKPLLRKSQACGPGEYFAVDPVVSSGYAGSTG